jgi:hypothetical protein
MTRHRTRWLAAGIGLLVAATLGVVALPASARAGTGTVTGHFTDGGTPIPDAAVALYDLDFNQVRDTTTDAEGAFALTDVPVGEYKLSFSIIGVITQFAFGKTESFEGADIITVSDGEVTTVDDTLAPHGAISGRVTDSAGAPVPLPIVSAFGVECCFSASVQGDDAGNYTLGFLPAGSYVVQFRARFETPFQYAHQKRDSSDADPIAVVNGETTALDEQLLPTGTIRGRFTKQGEPIADANVDVFDPTTGHSQSSPTGPDGEYELQVWPGTYVVRFDRSDGTLVQYARQKRTEREADRFPVGAGDVVVVDEEAIATGTITGRLTDADGNPVGGAGVSAGDATSDLFGRTDADGRYQIEALPGPYRVSFNPGNGRQWAFGKSSAGTADVVTVVAGESTVVDDVLRPAGSATIRLVDAGTGGALQEFCVFIPGVFDSLCTTDGVVHTALLAGRYEISITHETPGYLHFARKIVTITSGQDLAVTRSVPREARITSTIRDAATGAPVANACLEPVEPLKPSSLGGRSFYCSDETGRVTVDQLSAGTYNLFVWARDGVHGHQWVGPNGGTGAQAKGRLVTIKAGQTVTVPPIRLDGAGTITGVVTSAVTGDAPDGMVGLSSFSGGAGGTEAQVAIGPDGRYTISGLGPYSWPLFFAAFQHAYQWSGGTPNRFLASGVRVRVGATTTYNQTVRRGSTLSARVVGPGGAPIDFGRITLQNAVTGDLMGEGDCEATTRCDVPALGPQSVKLFYNVRVNGEDYAGYYRDAADFLHATVVLIPSSGTRNVTVQATRLQN